jgi:hypothetical protein
MNYNLACIGESNRDLPQARSHPFVVHNNSEEQSKEHLILLSVHTLISNQGVCDAL